MSILSQLESPLFEVEIVQRKRWDWCLRDRSGKVVTSRLVRTSGSAALDQETMDTVRRAQPFPSPPANMPGETFEFTVPIRFNIH